MGQIQAGLSERQVAANFNVHPKTIRRLVTKFRQTGDVKDRPRSGRPKVTTAREDRRLINVSLRSRFKSGKLIFHLLLNFP